jgi:hypothetical protein
MKKVSVSLLFVVNFLYSGLSQSQVFLASTGIVVGSYQADTDIISPDNNIINQYLQQKHAGQRILSFNIEKEDGVAYLISEVEYGTANGNPRLKKVAERLFSSEPNERFSNSGECEEHICDGGCRTEPIVYLCTCCRFVRSGGFIVGCTCCDSGICCHTVKTCPPGK